MKLTGLILCSVYWMNYALAATQFAPFDLENKERSICKAAPATAGDVHCLPTVQSLGSNLASTLEIMTKAKAYNALLTQRGNAPELTPDEFAAAGGAVMLSKSQLEKLATNFRSLLFHSFAMTPTLQTDNDGRQSLHFYASLDWVTTSGGQGTINVSGRFFSQGDPVPMGTNVSVSQMQTALGKMIDIQQISGDVNTGVGNEHQETTRLLEKVVTPFIFGEFVYVPVTSGLMQAASEIGESASIKTEAKLTVPEQI